MDDTTNIVIGSFEPVCFPDFNGYEVVAKIDTGAYTGALHCTTIQEEETANGPVLNFSPFDHPEVKVSLTEFAVNHVKSSNGKIETRYFIDTNIIVAGSSYPIVLSLADRSEMKWPVLIGRKFLRKHNFLVDVNRVNK
ncbi:ATP-dependent zinc protease [Candidatus Saccharibacteria bacterium]|nr:ATP-dependent zinc protease [Candidatus Saccharibacteria bacterium]